MACSCNKSCHKNTTVFAVYHWATSSKFFLSNCDTVLICTYKHVHYDPILLSISCTVLLWKHVNNAAVNNQQWHLLWTLNLHYIHSVPNVHKTFLLLLYILDVMLPYRSVLLLHNVLNNISLCTSILPLSREEVSPLKYMSLTKIILWWLYIGAIFINIHTYIYIYIYIYCPPSLSDFNRVRIPASRNVNL